MIKAFEIKVIGHVQGVFFRKSTQEKAHSLGVKGWIRNLSDGNVLINAEAETDKINELISWCKVGPQEARVDKLDISEIAIKNYNNFEIRY